jgi:hypothetical protein
MLAMELKVTALKLRMLAVGIKQKWEFISERHDGKFLA